MLGASGRFPVRVAQPRGSKKGPSLGADMQASIVSRLDSGSDVRISTLKKHSAALGMRLEVRLLPNKARRPKPPSKQGAQAGKRARKGANPVNKSATG